MVQRSLIGLILSLLAVSGCAAPSTRPDCAGSASAPMALDCRESVPSPLVPDVSLVRLPPVIDRINREETEEHCPLSENDLRCLAASRSAAASLLQAESNAAVSQSTNSERRSACLHSEILRLRSIHERNRTAAAASVLYLRLAEAEGAAQNLDRSLRETEDMLEDMRQFQFQGIQLPVTAGQIRQRRLELQHQEQELRLTILQLNGQLGQLFDLEADHAPIWPDVDLTVSEDSYDGGVEVEIALATRADLAALRHAARNLDEDTLPAVRALVLQAGLGGTLGLASSRGRRLAALRTGTDLPVRRRQIQEMIVREELKVQRDVMSAIRGIETRLRQIGLTKQIRALRQDEVKHLERQLDAGAATTLDLREAKLNVLSADTDLLRDVIEWKLAIVKLREVQGLLAEECGSSICNCD